MSQYSNRLLGYLQSEYSQTGKTIFSYPDMLNCIDDIQMLERAISLLEESKSIRNTGYVNSFELLNLPD